MSFSTFTHQYPTRKNDLIFIDVDPKPPIAAVKEECPSSPDEKLIKVKEKEADKKEKFQCSECSLTTYSADRMTRHMRKHRGENPFQCNWCQYSTYNSTLFEEHVNIHKGIKPYQCKLCEYRSVSKKYMKKHESRHGTCDKCGFVARDIRLLRRHKRQNGCAENADETTKLEKFTCENCSIFYNTPECLKQHIKMHKICPECGEGFSTQVLTKHRFTVHGVQRDIVPKKCKFKCAECVKPYQCKLCEYRSVSKKYMKKHESRHETCDKCGFVARDIRLLRRHKRQNGCAENTVQPTNLEKFTCENCNIFYNIPECLKQHIEMHKICPECGEGFSTQVLTKHRFTVHGVQRDIVPKKCKFKCAECEWQSNCHQKILLHLIHHPSQEVDASIDITPLVNAEILTGSLDST